MAPRQPPQPPRRAPDPEPGSGEPGRHGGVTPDEIHLIPSLPGVYIMRDEAGKVLYVGKAGNLHSRVHAYFTREGEARFNVRFLMRHVARIETIITANEKEAFLLENTLIKKHQPRYNIRLRDDKTYVSVRVNVRHEWPRAVVTRRRHEGRREDAVYLGPYASASAVRETLRQLQRVFPIRSCPDHVLRNRTRPCLLHPIGRCCAPCVKEVDKQAYREMVEGTILFLKGRTREVLDELRRKMARHAEAMEFEAAATVRDRIAAIEQTVERQGVHSHGGSDRDVVTLEQAGGYAAFVVFVYRNGLLVSSRPFLVRDHERNPDDLLGEFLTRYYEVEKPPAELVVDPLPCDAELLERWLGEHREGPVRLGVPQRGEKRRLVASARENARQLLEQHHAGRETQEAVQQEIMEKLHLPAPPVVIECYDISTIQGHATVGSMVTFREGEPDKSRYRRFRIKTIEGQDDFGALSEMLTRRLRRVASGEEAAPALMVIDGGKGQLAVAVDALEQAGLAGRIPVVGMAKARVKRRGKAGEVEPERTEERFFLPGRKNPVRFRGDSPALYQLMRLRDEAHRFGITYHRELRRRLGLRSRLETVPGVGPTRTRALLRHFGSLRALREASPEAIAKAPGIPAELARLIHETLASDPPAEAPVANEAVTEPEIEVAGEPGGEDAPWEDEVD